MPVIKKKKPGPRAPLRPSHPQDEGAGCSPHPARSHTASPHPNPHSCWETGSSSEQGSHSPEPRRSSRRPGPRAPPDAAGAEGGWGPRPLMPLAHVRGLTCPLPRMNFAATPVCTLNTGASSHGETRAESPQPQLNTAEPPQRSRRSTYTGAPPARGLSPPVRGLSSTFL